MGFDADQLIANVAIINTMKQTSYVDGRLAAFFEPNGNGEYTGGISGSNFSTSSKYKSSYWCRPVASYDMPVYFITRSEIEFFIAEYYAKAGNAAQAKAHYEAAINASFETAGVPGAAEAIKQFPYDQANYKKCIGISKWIALAGVNTFEGWCEARRLDFPAFGAFRVRRCTTSRPMTATSPNSMYPARSTHLSRLRTNLVLTRFLSAGLIPKALRPATATAPTSPAMQLLCSGASKTKYQSNKVTT